MTNIQISDDRRALLGHYCAKSNNETIIILTLAIVFFTAFQVLISLGLPEPIFVGIGVDVAILFILAMIRQIGRLIWWSLLSEVVLYVDLVDIQESSKVTDSVIKYGIPLDPHSDIWRLYYSCCKLAGRYKDKEDKWNFKYYDCLKQNYCSINFTKKNRMNISQCYSRFPYLSFFS